MENIFYNFLNNQKNQKSDNDNIENLMYPIDRPDPTQFFLDVRQLVGCWLQKEIDKLKGAHWLKTNLTYPSFEHLSMAYKNQIFCIIIDVINEKTNKHYLPEQYRQNLVKECTNNNLIPCIYKVFVNDPLNPAYNTLKPISTGWNLYHAVTDETIIPENIATDELVKMSEWEMHDFAIQIVRDYITKNLNYKLLSYQNILGIEPQLWLEDNNMVKKYVLVRYTMFPNEKAKKPTDINKIHANCQGHTGYFASVAFCSQGIDKTVLYRGDGAYIRFEGLESI